MNLAQIDGQLHPSELAFLMALMAEYKVNPSEFKHLGSQYHNSLVDKINNRFEFLYLCLRLIRVDNHVALSELSFCRHVALRLGFKPAVVDHFSERNLDNPAKFRDQLSQWII